MLEAGDDHTFLRKGPLLMALNNSDGTAEPLNAASTVLRSL